MRLASAAAAHVLLPTRAVGVTRSRGIMLSKMKTLVAIGATLAVSFVAPAMAVPVAVPEPSPVSVLVIGLGLAAYLARPKKS